MKSVRVVRRPALRSVEERLVDLGARLIEMEMLLHSISKEVSEMQKIFIPKEQI